MPSYNAAWELLIAGVVLLGWPLPIASSFAGPSCSSTNTCSLPSAFVKPRRNGRSYIGSVTYASRLAVQSKSSNNEEGMENCSNIVWLRQRFDLKDEWAAKVSQSAIGKSIDTLDRAVIAERIDFLKQRIKLSKQILATIVRKHPGILKYRSDENIGPTIDFLSDRLGLGTKAISKMVQAQPTLLNLKQETLQRTLEYIESRICLNDTKKVATVVKKFPVLLSLSIDENLEPTIIKFQKYFGYDDAEVSKIFMRHPSLLSLDFDKSIKAKIEWFQEILYANVEEISKIVKKQPTLFASSIDSLESNRVWLKKRLQVDDKALKKMIVTIPNILYLSQEENVEPTIQWLESEFGASAKFLVQKFPPLLACNITTNTEPTLRFYEECVGEEKAKAMITVFPTYLGYSLENRLKPRLEDAEEKGMVVDARLMHKMAVFTKAKWEAELQDSSRATANGLAK